MFMWLNNFIEYSYPRKVAPFTGKALTDIKTNPAAYRYDGSWNIYEKYSTLKQLTSRKDSETISPVWLLYAVQSSSVPRLVETVSLNPGLDHIQVDDRLPGQQSSQPAS